MSKTLPVKKRNIYSFFIPLSTKKAVLFITVIGIITYYTMLFNGTVWDDITFIFLNPQIHVFNLFQLFGLNSFNAGGYYRPVAATYFSFLYSLFGQQAFYFHLSQLLLHIVDTCLLFYFLKKFFKTAISFILAILFLIHPIQVESVSYIGASQSELLFLFGMSATLLSMQKKLNRTTILFYSLLLLLAVLTKETAFLFILVILLYQWLFLRNNFRIILIASFIDTLFYFLIRLQLFHVAFEENLTTPISRLSLLWRIGNIPSVFFYYLKTFMYPAKLEIDQRWIIHTIDFPHFYLPLLSDCIFFILVGVLGYYCKRKNQQTFYLFIFFFLWFLLGMGLLMQIIPLDMTVSDRWFYFPIVGLLGLIGLCYTFIQKHVLKHQFLFATLLIIVFLLLCTRTIVRNSNWSDPVTLYAHDSRLDPSNGELMSMLGSTFAINGQYKKALPYLLKIDMQQPDKITLSNTAMTYEKLGNMSKAVYFFKKALAVKNDYRGSTPDLMVYVNLGVIYLNNYKPSYTISYTKQLIQKYPKSGQIWLILAVAEYRAGMVNRALDDLNKAYSLDPTISYSYYANAMAQNLPIEIN